MASSREVKVLKKALELACIQLHGECPHPVPAECCDIVYMTESYMRQAEAAVNEGS
jgi:hypothetical protein